MAGRASSSGEHPGAAPERWVRHLTATLAGGWNDLGPVVARVTAPLREALSKGVAVVRPRVRRLNPRRQRRRR